MFNPTTSDRITLVGMGDLIHPGKCSVCGSGNCEEGYVDLHVYYDYEGQQYLCFTCVQQIAEVIGCLLPAEALILQELVKTSEREKNAAQGALTFANERLQAYDTALAGIALFSDTDSPSLSVVPDSEESGTESNEQQVDESVTEGADSGESEVKKSTSGKRSSKSKRTRVVNVTSGDDKFDL